MKIQKEIKLLVELDSDEISTLRNARQILQRVEKEMVNYGCDLLLCQDEYHYEISDLRKTIDDLEMYEEITEVFC